MHNRQLKLIFIGLLFGISATHSYSQQDTMQLTLNQAIQLANDSSLNAFRQENLYIASYLNYKATLLPSLDFSAQPFTFNRSISKQFNPADTAYNYYEEQSLNSQFDLSLQQNIPQTGGEVYLKADLGRLENINQENIQYSSTLGRIGFSQPLFGFNRFKWEKKIEPVKYRKARKDYIQSAQKIALQTINHFFSLASAKIQLKIAQTNAANADTLYSIGKKRLKLASISKADLLNLQLEKVNSQNTLKQAKQSYTRSLSNVRSFLNISHTAPMEINLPDDIPECAIQPDSALAKARDNNPSYEEFLREKLQAQKQVTQTKKQRFFNASLDASFGLNQRAEELAGVYDHPLNQQRLNLSLNIPIVDWGLREGRYQLAKRRQKATKIEIQQEKRQLRQEIIMTVSEFNIQSELVKSAQDAEEIAEQAYEEHKERFRNGLIDVNTLLIQQERMNSAQQKYISALQKYWNLYYTIQRLTLHDFRNNQPLTETFEEKLKVESF